MCSYKSFCSSNWNLHSLTNVGPLTFSLLIVTIITFGLFQKSLDERWMEFYQISSRHIVVSELPHLYLPTPPGIQGETSEKKQQN